MPSLIRIALAAAAALVMAASLLTQGLTPEPPIRLTAFAVNMSNIATGGARTVDITIDRWSTDDERQQLISAFVEKGSDALLTQLQRLKRVGYIRLPNTVGYDLHFARKHLGEDGGEQIIVMTDRRIGFAEARNQPRSIDYSFTLMDIRLNAKGEGEGKMSVATKIAYNKKKNTVELENYGSEPVRLNNVRAEPKK